MTSTSKSSAWRTVSAVTVLFCLLYGLPNFTILATYLPQRMDLRSAAAWTVTGFGLSALVLLIVIMAWLRRRQRSLKDVGWAKPTRIVAIVLAVAFAFAFLGLGYTNNRRLGVAFAFAEIDGLRIWAALLTVFAGGFVEEIAMRGVVITELHRIGTRTWLQILVSAFCFALYHSMLFVTKPIMFVQGLVSSMFMGCLLAGLYILGKRSLIPCIICHALANLLGEPYLLMGAMAAYVKIG